MENGMSEGERRGREIKSLLDYTLRRSSNFPEPTEDSYRRQWTLEPRPLNPTKRVLEKPYKELRNLIRHGLAATALIATLGAVPLIMNYVSRIPTVELEKPIPAPEASMELYEYYPTIKINKKYQAGDLEELSKEE